MSDYQTRAEIDVIATDLRANEDRCDHCRHRRNDEWCEMDMRAVETRKEKSPDFAQIYTAVIIISSRVVSLRFSGLKPKAVRSFPACS